MVICTVLCNDQVSGTASGYFNLLCTCLMSFLVLLKGYAKVMLFDESSASFVADKVCIICILKLTLCIYWMYVYNLDDSCDVN